MSKISKPDSTVIFYIYTFFSNFLFITVFSVNMIYQVQVAHLTALELVLIGTTLECSVLFFEIPTGIVADVYSRRLSVIIGTVMIGLGFLVESLFPAFYPILIAQVIWGIGYTFTSGALLAWITDEVGEARFEAVLLKSVQLEQVGAIIATLVAVAIGSYMINLPIFLAGCSFILMGLFLIIYMDETGFQPIPHPDRKPWLSMWSIAQQSINQVTSRRLLVFLVILSFFLGFYSEGFDRLWTPHLLNDLLFPSWLGFQPVVWFGLMTIAGSLITLGTTEFLHRRLQQTGSVILFRIMFLCICLLVASILIFALSTTVWIAVVSWIVIYVLRRAIEPAFTIWYNERINPAIRATMLSARSQVDAFGQVLGGPPIGYIGNVFNIVTALVVSASSLIPSLLFFIPFLNKRNLLTVEEISGDTSDKGR